MPVHRSECGPGPEGLLFAFCPLRTYAAPPDEVPSPLSAAAAAAATAATAATAAAAGA